MVERQRVGEHLLHCGQGQLRLLQRLHVEVGAGLELQQTLHGHEGQIAVVLGIYQRKLVAGKLRLGLEHVELGNFAGSTQLAAALKLGARKGGLVGRHLDHLLAIEHLQILRNDVQRHIVLRGLELLHDGLQVGLGIVEAAHSGEALEYGHAQPHVHSEALRVAVGVGVVGGEAAAEVEVLAGISRGRWHEAVAGVVEVKACAAHFQCA